MRPFPVNEVAALALERLVTPVTHPSVAAGARVSARSVHASGQGQFVCQLKTGGKPAKSPSARGSHVRIA